MDVFSINFASHDSNAVVYLSQKLSAAIQRGNAGSLWWTLPASWRIYLCYFIDSFFLSLVPFTVQHCWIISLSPLTLYQQLIAMPFNHHNNHGTQFIITYLIETVFHIELGYLFRSLWVGKSKANSHLSTSKDTSECVRSHFDWGHSLWWLKWCPVQ